MTHAEYLMKFEADVFAEIEGKILAEVHNYQHDSLDCEAEDDTLYYYEGDSLVGQCSLYIENSRVNMYDVQIMPEYQNQGYGLTMLVHFIMEEYPYLDEIFPIEKKNRELVLQVSETNLPALKLYMKVGFRVLDSVQFPDDSE